MTNRFTYLLPGLLLCLYIAGCAAPQIPSSPTSVPLQFITRLASEQLFAANSQGSHLAYADNGLWLRSLDAQDPLKLDPGRPLALSWSDNGERFSAAFGDASGQTRLAVYSREGQLLSEDLFQIEFMELGWSQRGDLLLVGYTLKNYRFGSNLSLTLQSIDQLGVHTEIVLGDTTLKPSTAKRYEASLKELLRVCFTSGSDELVYTRLHDPPEFPPYLQLVFRSWLGGPEKLLAQLEPARYDLQFANNNSSLWAIPQGRASVEFPLWGDDADWKQEVTFRREGQVSPGGAYRFSDGLLYAGSRLLASWPAGSRLQFLREGKFLLADQHALYLGSGLQAEPWPSYLESEWTLRKWLHQRLISLQDYRRLRQEQKE